MTDSADVPTTDSANAPPAEAKVEPEFVLTPEVMRRENRRNDIILALGVILFGFFLSSFLETMPDIWLRFRTGQLIDQSLPHVPGTDTLTYTAEGRAWTNPNWLFDWTIYLIYAWFGDGTLIAAKALVCALVGWILISLRYPGPTLWWSAMCVVPALTAMSERFYLSPDIAEMLMVGLFLLFWFQARYRQRWWLLYAIIPLTALWANLSITFFLAPLLLVLIGIGESIQLLFSEKRSFAGLVLKHSPMQIFLVAGLAAAATLLNPYGWEGATLPFRWFDSILPRVAPVDLEAAGWTSMTLNHFSNFEIVPWSWRAWLFLVAASTLSFVVNAARFSVSRFLLNVLAMLLPLYFARFVAPLSMVLAMNLSLNGQEFFLSLAGEKTRINTGWWIWSIAGRAVSILLIAGLILAACTGRVQGLIGRFGYGILMDRFMVDGNTWLNEVNPQGNGFSFSLAITSYEAWASPQRKSFIDNRWPVVAGELGSYSQLRELLHVGQSQSWKPIFDKYNITYIIYDPREKRVDTLPSLLNSPDLAPVYVSDQAVIFCRTDANIDVDRFASHRIEPNQIVFKTGHKPPIPTDRFTEAPGIIDRLWRFRYVLPSGYEAGEVYLQPVRPMTRPGANFLALAKFRDAVSNNPDNSRANLALGRTLVTIYRDEASACVASLEDGSTADDSSKPVMLRNLPGTTTTGTAAGKAPTREIPSPRFLMGMRHYQIIAALQNAVTAGPLDPNPDLDMFAYCSGSKFYDLALQHLEASRKWLAPAQWNLLKGDYETLTKAVAQRRELYDKDVALMTQQLKDQGVETDRPLERAMIAMRYELPALAVEQLEQQSPFSPEMMQAAPFAIGLYLSVGRPDRALERLRMIQSQSPLQPGELDWLNAQVRLTTGQYDEARALLEHAIAEVRVARAQKLLLGVEDRLRNGRIITMPVQANQVLGELEREALYWFQLGLIRIEMGEPHLLRQAFEKTLELSPHFTLRPVIELYWNLAFDDKLPPEPEAPDEATLIAKNLQPAGEQPAKNQQTPAQPAPESSATENPAEPAEQPAAPASDSPPATPKDTPNSEGA